MLLIILLFVVNNILNIPNETALTKSLINKPYYYSYSWLVIKHVNYNQVMTDNFIDDAAKKLKNSQQDAKAEAETAQDHAEGKPSSETLNKAKEKVKDALD